MYVLLVYTCMRETSEGEAGYLCVRRVCVCAPLAYSYGVARMCACVRVCVGSGCGRGPILAGKSRPLKTRAS